MAIQPIVGTLKRKIILDISVGFGKLYSPMIIVDCCINMLL